MPPAPGELAGPKTWLIARSATKPGQLLRLGSILTDALNPGSSLNLGRIVAVPAECKYDDADLVKLRIESELHQSRSLLVSAASSIPVLSAAAALDGCWSRDPRTTVDALNVRATSFVPTKEYMDEALADESVVEYLRRGLFAKSIYLIVGVATASRLSVVETQAGTSGLGASAKATVPEAVDLGIEASHRSQAGSTVTKETAEDCDFAYRVREFEYSRIPRRVRDKGLMTKKTMFGLEEKATSSDDLDDAVPQFEWFEDEDVSVDGSEGGLVVLAD
ncbi:hypothetical protein BJX68DRAFT_23370 [Aspergillus pseudodeflectus]|uniref:Uncharacterized protein n=1 Tax=Aspergillus pseudodeflectus TaxID=176178 RepID=A0ABR4KS81_9EURO